MGELKLDQRLLDALDSVKKSFVYSEDTPSGRVYNTPDGKKYPSVTTVLSKMSDKSSLDEWRSRVGEEAARKITQDAGERGTIMHEMIESYFRNEPIDSKGNAIANKLYRSMSIYFKRMNVVDLEFALWSDTMKIAGRVDCLGYFDGVLSIIDFKSSRKEKPEQWIKDYFIQTTLYSMMLYELTGIECKQIVILISPEEGFPQVFKKPVADYIHQAYSLVKSYHEKNQDVSRGASRIILKRGKNQNEQEPFTSTYRRGSNAILRGADSSSRFYSYQYIRG